MISGRSFASCVANPARNEETALRVLAWKPEQVFVAAHCTRRPAKGVGRDSRILFAGPVEHGYYEPRKF
jgi:hypothetical protein